MPSGFYVLNNELKLEEGLKFRNCLRFTTICRCCKTCLTELSFTRDDLKHGSKHLIEQLF